MWIECEPQPGYSGRCYKRDNRWCLQLVEEGFYNIWTLIDSEGEYDPRPITGIAQETDERAQAVADEFVARATDRG